MVAKHSPHTPVLLGEVLKYLDPQAGESYLDLTAGYGGHAKAVLERTLSPDKATLVDRDREAIGHLKRAFGNGQARIIHSDFLSASRELAATGNGYDLILADLGVSSVHLDVPERGFGFNAEAPLDMRMDQRQELTAGDIINVYPESDIARILRQYGEEPKAARLAKAIVAARPVETTSQLADIVKSVWPGKSRVHPATRTFQALRIAVNGELDQLGQALPIWTGKLLKPGGRIAVISFHSLEDRLVKRHLQAVGGERFDAQLRLLTKRPITAGQNEIVSNPRARSAKLRAAVKIKTKERRDYAYPG